MKKLILISLVCILASFVHCNEPEVVPNVITVLSPEPGQIVMEGYPFLITWKSSIDDNVDIELWKDGEKLSDIASDIPNVNAYEWKVEEFSNGEGYEIRISNHSDPDQKSQVTSFEILDYVSLKRFTNYSRDFLEFEEKSLEFFTGGNEEVTVVFEHGMGNDGRIWFLNSSLEFLLPHVKFVTYSRSGMGASTSNGEVRNLENITEDLKALIDAKVTTEKIILVGHSWGGPILRYFAMKNPEMISAYCFIDPTAEYNFFTQEDEDDAVAELIAEGKLGTAAEAEQIMETIELLPTLPDMPDVPILLLSDSKYDDFWKPEYVDLQAKVGHGVSDFTHIKAPYGHYLHLNNPPVFYAHFSNLLAKVKMQ